LSSILFLLLFPGYDYLQTGDCREANRYYNLISRIAPSYENSFYQAVCALTTEEITGQEILSALAYGKPCNKYYLGVAQYRFGLYDDAFANLHLVEDKIWQSYYYLGLISLKGHKIEEAKDYFHRIPESDKKSWLLDYLANYERLVNAQRNFIEGSYKEAIKIYKTVENFFGYKELGIGMAHGKISEYKKAIALFDTVIAQSRDSTLIERGLFEAGSCCFALRNYQRAKSYLGKFLSFKSFDYATYLMGEIYFNEGKYDSADWYFKELPDSVDDYLFFKARTDYFRGRWAKAEQRILQHLECFPNSRHGDRALYILASINFQYKEYDSAIEHWRELIKKYPNSIYAASALSNIGDAYCNKNDYKKALAAYKAVKDYKPSPKVGERAALKIYETLYQLGTYPTLISALKKFIEKNPQSNLVANVRLRIARLLFEKKEYYQSLLELDSLIEEYPAGPITNEAYIERIQVCKKLGDKKGVKSAFLYLLKDKTNQEYYSFATMELASIYRDESAYDSALYFYNLLLDFDDYQERAILEIARIYNILEQYEAAEMMIAKLIDKFPSSSLLVDAYILKSQLAKRKGDFKEAIAILQKATQEIGPKPEIYLEIGNSYFEIEDFVNAKAYYLSACEQFKQERDMAARALILAGSAAMKLGDVKSAREYYLRAQLIAESLALKDQASAKLSSIGEE